MSIWFHYDITVIGDKKAIAKFLHTNEDDVRIEDFKISFGQKHGPGINITEMVRSNPDLIFKIHESSDYDQTFWIERFDSASNDAKAVLIAQHTYGEGTDIINRKIIEQYAEAYPQQMESIKKGKPYNWELFLSDYDRVAKILDNQKEYEDMYDERTNIDFEMENATPWEPND